MEKIKKSLDIFFKNEFIFLNYFVSSCVMRNEGEDSFYSYISYEKTSVGK